MISYQVGDVRITRVEEMVDHTSFTAKSFLPTHDPEAFATERPWMDGPYYDPQTECVILSIHSWLIRTPQHTVLIDTCVGNHKYRNPVMPQWHELDTPYLQTLARAGVTPDEIDFVMCSHLHVDHVGWNTQLQDGRWVPTFPNAKYIFSQIENDHAASSPSRWNQTVYNDSVLPVIEAGQSLLVQDGHQVDDLMSVLLTPGHTPGSITIRLKGARDDRHPSALFVGDAIHHPIQILYPDWSASPDTDPVQSADTKRRLLAEAADCGALLMPAHFNAPHACRIHDKAGKFEIDWATPNG